MHKTDPNAAIVDRIAQSGVKSTNANELTTMSGRSGTFFGTWSDTTW